MALVTVFHGGYDTHTDKGKMNNAPYPVFDQARPTRGRSSATRTAACSTFPNKMGNIYTTETYHGPRLQKFVYKGLAPVTKKHQGTVWPSR